MITLLRELEKEANAIGMSKARSQQNYFLIIQKQRDNQSRIRKLILNEKEINNETEILNQIKLFCEILFQSPSKKDSADDFNHFLNTLDTPKPSTKQIILCDIELTEMDLYDSMKSMENDKSLGKDGLTKQFYVIYWDERLKQPSCIL